MRVLGKTLRFLCLGIFIFYLPITGSAQDRDCKKIATITSSPADLVGKNLWPEIDKNIESCKKDCQKNSSCVGFSLLQIFIKIEGDSKNNYRFGTMKCSVHTSQSVDSPGSAPKNNNEAAIETNGFCDVIELPGSRCGPSKFGDKSIKGECSSGRCCSDWGWCGSGSNYCGRPKASAPIDVARPPK